MQKKQLYLLHCFRLASAFIVIFSFINLKAYSEKWHIYEGKSIQTSIDLAQNGDTIIIHPGTYIESLSIRGKNLIIKGKNNPILSGNNSNRILYIDNVGSYSITKRQTKIKKIIFKNGYISKETSQSLGPGAAILIRNQASVTLIQCQFIDNRSDYDGGAIGLLENSNSKIKNCTFENNTTFRMGGALFIHDSSPKIKNSTFDSNTAEDKPYKVGNDQNANGGAIQSGGNSYVSIKNSTFVNNRSKILGGAIIFSNHGGKIINNIIKNNYTQWHGAGISINGTGTDEGITIQSNSFNAIPTNTFLVQIKGNIISNNICHVLGAGIHVEGGGNLLEIKNNQIMNNQVTLQEVSYPYTGYERVGAGLYCYNAHATISENTFSGNLSEKSAAMSLENGPVWKDGYDYTIENNIIENNISEDAFPGITIVFIENEYFDSGSSTSALFKNNTVSNNTINNFGFNNEALAIFNSSVDIIQNQFASNDGDIGIFGDSDVFQSDNQFS